MRERFLANIRLHLRSDVPVGAALSGGLDSSAIVSAVHYLEPSMRLNTFSFISANSKHSEERWVDIVNAHIGAVVHKVRPKPEDLAADLQDLVRLQGEPFGSASIYAQYRVFRMAREAGVPVTLDGQGADEILAGYWPYVCNQGRISFTARTGASSRSPSLVCWRQHCNTGTARRTICSGGIAFQLGSTIPQAGWPGTYARLHER